MTEWFVARLPQSQTNQTEEEGHRWQEIHREVEALTAWLPRLAGESRISVVRVGSVYAQHCGPFRLWVDFCEKLLQDEVAAEQRSNVLWTLAQVARAGGFLDRALAAARQKIEVDQERGDARAAALGWGAVADILQSRGDLDESLRIRQEEELPVYEKIGDIRSRAVTVGKIADILRTRGDLDEALRIYLEEELPIYERLQDQRNLLAGRANVASLLLSRGNAGDREQAQELLCLALRAAEAMRIPEAGKIRSILARHDLSCGGATEG